jgi:hypothetical protein
MKYAYIITIIFLLFSCGKQVEKPVTVDTMATEKQTIPVDTSVSEEQTESVTEKDAESINTMV